MRFRRVPFRSRAAQLAWSLVFWTGLLCLSWLDAGCTIPTRQAAYFIVIWEALVAISAALGDAALAVAATLEGVVVYLAGAVAWLVERVASILLSTGAVFARVWDAIRVVWSDVLKPALVFLDRQILRFYEWLKDTLAPVFEYLNTVREKLQLIYRRFVQPIIDTIEFLRALNRVLLAFHIRLLQQLDVVLQRIETRIEEPFLWINAKLNEIWNALDLVVTGDGFFQRYTLIRSLSKHAPPWMNGFWNTQADKDALAGDDYSRGRDYPHDEVWAPGKELAQFYRGEDSRISESVAELVPIWRQAAGVDPPGPDNS